MICLVCSGESAFINNAMRTELRSDRLLLRRFSKNDAEDIFAYIRNREISRNTFIPYPYAINDAHSFIRLSQKQWRKGTDFHFAIEYAQNQRVIGAVGFNAINTKHQFAELGYWLGKRYWGGGIMTEAVQLSLELGFRDLKLFRISAHVFAHNDASAQVLEKNGFIYEGTLRKKTLRGRKRIDHVVYSILRDEWTKK